jgi:asparagine synthase (glutamine-hydrolysing)
MCGIAGYIGRDRIPEERIRSTLELMRNRGPDHQESRIFEEDGFRTVLLHSRLSILDLDPRSNQPFCIGRQALAFNGEIYNYQELREDLKKEGFGFKTDSDTEVLLQCYRAKGVGCTETLEGMWGFGLYDGEKRRLLLSRDRFGEKPLYWLRAREGIFFGSEVKFLRSLSGLPLRVNTRHVLRYLVNGYKALYKTGETFFEGVAEVPIATTLEIGPDLRIEERTYWHPAAETRAMTQDEAVEGFKERLMRSVSIRLRADVPMAFCLSGGVDSAAIASIAAKVMGHRVHTFSIVDPDERYNEWENIRATVEDLGCSNTVISLPKPGALERLERLVAYHDGPLATISYFVHSYLSEEMASRGFRVSFSGTGADELVTGYYDHFNLHLREIRGSPRFQACLDEWRKWIAPIVRNPHLGRPDLYFENPGFRDHIYLNNAEFAGYLRVPFSEDFLEAAFCGSLLRNRMMNEMFHEGTRVILHEDDLNSMMHSIENRSPYLDSRLFEFSHSIPADHLIRDGYGKYVLRQAIKGILNEQVRTDRKKKGFNASIHSIIDLADGPTREAILAPSPIFELVDRGKIAELMDLKPMPNSWSKFIFSFLNAKIFLEQHG